MTINVAIRKSQCKLTLGSTLRALYNFFFFGGGLVSSSTALDAVQVRSSFALIQAQDRTRTMTFPVIQSQ